MELLSMVNVNNFVPLKLLGCSNDTNNYYSWRLQMLGLLDSYDLRAFITASQLANIKGNYEKWSRDQLLRGWILGTVSDGELLAYVSSFDTAIEAWLALEKRFGESGQQLGVQSPMPSEKPAKSKEGLYKAILSADFPEVKKIIDGDENAIRATFGPTAETALHIAVRTRKPKEFLEDLVKVVDEESLMSLEGKSGNTALHVAALIGYRHAARQLVEKCPGLLVVGNRSKELPVHLAAIFAHKKTLEYLLFRRESNTIRPEYGGFKDSDCGVLLRNNLIEGDMLDIACRLVEEYPSILDDKTYWDPTLLKRIALKVKAFRSGQRYSFWQRFIYTYVPVGGASPKTQRRKTSNIQDIEGQASCNELNKTYQIVQNWCAALIQVTLDQVPFIEVIRTEKRTHEQVVTLVKHLCMALKDLDPTRASEIITDVLFTAASLGVYEIIDKIIETHPDAIHSREDSVVQSLCHVAVENRNDQVFYRICETKDLKHRYLNRIDSFENNLLHVAARLAPQQKLNLVSGAALQMQRERQWYKEIEDYLHPNSRTQVNKARKTPEMIFTEEHESLKVEGEKWMKDTAYSCTFAAALITTVMFAAAFTVPGGNVEHSGTPFFCNDPGFIIFAIADAISLFTSTTSLLMFLSILTSRYAEDDFLHTLPKRLIVGLVTLFVSITFMMLAFSATVYLVFTQKKKWILAPVAAFACLPVTSFVHLQFPLLVDVISSTYGHRVFGKGSGRPFY